MTSKEHLVGHLQRHLDTWPQLRPNEPVAGGVLIVNHQHKQPPSERSAAVYSRPEFVKALSVQVVSTLELFNWWRARDWNAIRRAVLGEDGDGSDLTSPVPGGDAAAGLSRPGRWRTWRSRNHS